MTRPDELRLEAAQKRQELADTLDQLMARTDLRRRVAARVDYRTALLMGAVVGVVAVAVGVALSRIRHGGFR